ncbi:putative pyoverdine dityrosine biosynthesis protein [Lasiodiplodia theobromae]|uniref:Spore wall maturation protein DIT1 n=1 Tax=Lasiodiplodia theobromae TaxID=45133 RepID=A0A5N5DLH6_9PEZI|nr:Spore wall maturation protein DIT1 [Lasiodiplodia theobromae]KAF9640737.1 putative pyoverdine dityrosine biosynthesis protein [Lasiodiplodia theobromae]
MSSLNSGSSIYHGVQGFYWRRPDFSLVSTHGTNAANLESAWSQLRHQLSSIQPRQNVALSSEKHIKSTDISLSLASESSTYCVRELHNSARPDSILGLVCTKSAGPTSEESSMDLVSWAELFVLCETRLLPPTSRSSATPDQDDAQLASRIAEIFDQYLRNVVPHDKWNVGRSYFEARVLDFVSRRLPVRFCLPAFPCKSPSAEKTCGTDPDRAEYLALKTLDEFARRVGDVYSPGAIVLIVSDGHVFSDLLEVKDDQVDIYGESLKQMYYRMKSSNQCNGNIQFTSLTEIFFGNDEVTGLFQEKWVEKDELTHPIDSERSENAELCRKLMMALGQNDKTILRSLISSQDPSTLGLYRGLSRFMLDDLAQSRAFAGLSMSKRKKISSSVASEMIVRNCAYSNLVELLFPSHVRLSIHAHDNSGPKFAIRLLKAIAVEDLETRNAQKSLDNYHTPTPWHNCLAYVEGESTPYLIKARAAHDAMAKGYLQGAWTESDNGGCFALKPVRPQPLAIQIPQSPVAAMAAQDEVVVSAIEKPQPLFVQEYPMLQRMLPLVYLPMRWAVEYVAWVGGSWRFWASA